MLHAGVMPRNRARSLLAVLVPSTLAVLALAAPPARADATPPAAPAARASAARDGAPVRVLGVLSRQHRRVCKPPRGDESWVDPRLEVGFVPLVGNVERFAGLVGKLVVVEGTRAEPSAAPAADDEEICPLYQMRSDMVVTKGGMRLRRARSAAVAALPALRVTSVREYRGLSVSRDGDRITVELRNELGAALSQLAVTVHYEGCRGKPGADARTERVATLAPGATARLSFPALLDTPDRSDGRSGGRPDSRRPYAAHSVQLDGDGPVLFDADVASVAGVRCPER